MCTSFFLRNYLASLADDADFFKCLYGMSEANYAKIPIVNIYHSLSVMGSQRRIRKLPFYGFEYYIALPTVYFSNN